MACGNIISYISDNFSQFCILKSIRDKIKVKKLKVWDFSRFSRDSFNADLSNVDWNALLNKKPCDKDNLFPSFYNKFNKLIKYTCTYENNFKPQSKTAP